MPALLEPKLEEAKRLGWEIGYLKYKLQPAQRIVYDTIDKATPEEPFCIVCSRGFGKTFIACTKAIETARRHENVNILIVSSTLKNLRKIIKPAFDILLEDCPDEFQPRFNSIDSCYEFPGRTIVHLVAAESGHIEKIRGLHNVILVLIDESAFFGDEDASFPLDHVIENIINPMFLRTKARARVLMMTTPPETPNHPFKTYFESSKLKGCTATFSIYQSDIPPARIEEEKRRCKDENAWRREYLCEWVIDQSRLIIPEWKQSYVQDIPKDEFFNFYHKYDALDTGVRDFTVDLLSHYDFKRAALVVDDEIVLKNEEVRTDILAAQIKAKEKELYGATHTREDRSIHRRIGDNNNLIILQDLSGIHGLPFLPTTKDELFAMVNEVRLWINAGRVIVRPRCRHLIGCLENGIWDKAKKEFARSATFGHFDGLAALCYLVRNIDTNTNPIPASYGLSLERHHIPPGHAEPENYKALRQALKLPSPKRTTDDWRKVA